MNKDKFLPVGSVIKISGSSSLWVINGYFAGESGSSKVYDYVIGQYPIGYTSDKVYFADRDSVQAVLFVGFQNEQFKKYLPILKRIRETIDSGGSPEDLIAELENRKEN